jgi:hypothetical protein
MSVVGQTRKYSLRANVFRCSPNNGHRSTPSAVRLGAKDHKPHRAIRSAILLSGIRTIRCCVARDRACRFFALVGTLSARKRGRLHDGLDAALVRLAVRSIEIPNPRQDHCPMLPIDGFPCFAMPRRRDATTSGAKFTALRLCADANPEPVRTSVIATVPPLLVKCDRIACL